MVRIKKLSIKRFECAADVEKFYDLFQEKNEIISIDVKIVNISKFKPTYLGIFEYYEK